MASDSRLVPRCVRPGSLVKEPSVLALVVDASKPSRSIVARVLRELALDCTEAANGAEALELVASAGPPDLMTVNWHMPVMDGLELIRRLRSDPATRTLPLVMIST